MYRIALSLILALGVSGQTFVFENVNVVPMDRERVLERQNVVVRDGRIAEVGPANKVKVPDNAQRIAASGKYLIPGLAEMHGHLPPPDAPPEATENTLFLFVANGVTLVRGMQGNETHLPLRERIVKENLLAPTLYVAGPQLSGNSAPSVDVATKMVREQKAAGFDLIKIQEGLQVDVYEAIAKTAREVKIPFGGHVPNDVGLLRALEAGQSTIDHLDNYLEALEPEDSPLRKATPQERQQKLVFHIDEKGIPKLVEATKKAGAAVVPTMALWDVLFGAEPLETLRGREELKYMPRQIVENWVKQKTTRSQNIPAESGKRLSEFRRRLLPALHQGGVKILFGTDAPQIFSVPGFSIHQEMKIMVECGMKPYEVLESGTRNVAEHFGASQQFGTVQAGRRADLVLLDANPLTDVGNVAKRAGVMVRGRWIPREEIDKRLQAIAAQN